MHALLGVGSDGIWGRKGKDKEVARITKDHEIVLKLRRPVSRQCILDAGARRPTPFVFAVRGDKGCYRSKGPIMCVMHPSSADLMVEQHTIDCATDTGGDGSKAIDLGSADKYKR